MLSKYALHQNNFYFYTPDLNYELVKQLNRCHVRSLDGRCVTAGCSGFTSDYVGVNGEFSSHIKTLSRHKWCLYAMLVAKTWGSWVSLSASYSNTTWINQLTVLNYMSQSEYLIKSALQPNLLPESLVSWPVFFVYNKEFTRKLGQNLAN